MDSESKFEPSVAKTNARTQCRGQVSLKYFGENFITEGDLEKTNRNFKLGILKTRREVGGFQFSKMSKLYDSN